MTANDHPPQIERLVDGELSFEEECQLLESFAEHPEGWRQLALVFLEERTFRSSLMTGPAQQVNPIVPAGFETDDTGSKHSDSRCRRISGPLQIGVVCAAILAAFFTGRYSSTPQTAAGNGPGSMTADSKSPPIPSPEQQLQQNDPLPLPLEFVSLEVGVDGGTVQNVDVPLMSWDQMSSSVELNELEASPSLISDDLRESLARRGQTIQERTEFYQFELSDGRVGVIPVSSLEIQSVNLPLIQ